MMSRKGIVKVMDFGLAKAGRELSSESGLTSKNVMMGTPLYMAPEQARDTTSADIRADIYSLGCTLFFLLTGRPPFEGPDVMSVVLKHVNETPPKVTDLRPEVPAGLATLIAKMLAKSREDRPQTPKEVAEALLPYTKKEHAAWWADQPQADAAIPERDLGLAETTSYRAGRSTSAMAKPAELMTATNQIQPPWERNGRKIAIAAGLLVALAAIVIAAIEIRVKTSEGIIVLTANEKDAKVLIDGEVIKVTQSDGEAIEICRPPGKHTLEVKKNGFTIESRELTLKSSDRNEVKIELKENDVKDTYARQQDKYAKFNMIGVWMTYHKIGDGWKGERTVLDNSVFLREDGLKLNWERKDSTIIMHFPKGNETLQIDLNDPDTLIGRAHALKSLVKHGFQESSS